MNDCKSLEDGLTALISGDSTTEERSAVMRHVAACEDCAELFAIHAELEDLELPAGAESDFSTMRRSVLRSSRVTPGDAVSLGWLKLFMPPFQPAALALLAVMTLAVGFFLGRGASADRVFEMARREDTRLATGNQTIAGQLDFAAVRNRRMEQSANSPYTFSDLRVQELESGQVELSFDVSTHLELVRDKSDPLVAEILVQSLVNPAPVGTRLEAISMVRSLEAKVRDALMVAMVEDESLAVRLAALEKLVDQPIDARTEAAFLSVLETEESVQMRLLAIDYLAQQHVESGRVETAVRTGRPEAGTALFVRAQDYFGRF